MSQKCDFGSQAILHIEGVVAGALAVEIIVGLDVRRQVNHVAFAVGDERLGIKRYALLAFHHFILVGNFFFDEDRFKRAFRDASTAVDAGIRINKVPGPFFGPFGGQF